jgi:hypothetical protein
MASLVIIISGCHQNVPFDKRANAPTWNKNSGQPVEYFLNSDRQIQTIPTNWAVFEKSNLQYDLICADSSYVLAKKSGSSALYYCGDKGVSAGQAVTMKQVKLLSHNYIYQDIACGECEEYSIGTIYMLSTNLKVYFTDVWTLASTWQWRELEIPLASNCLNKDSRISGARSVIFISGTDKFYAAWYDVSCSSYCIHVWPHIPWRSRNQWSAGVYPSGTGIKIDIKTIQAKRRLETQSVDEAKAILNRLFGSYRPGIIGIPKYAVPPTIQSMNAMLSDDDKLPVDVMFNGSYNGTNGIFYAKLQWKIDKGTLGTEWYFKGNTKFPLSFTEFTNKAIRIAQ